MCVQYRTFPFRWDEQYLCYAMKGELPWKDRQMHIIFLNPSQPGRSYLSDTLKGRRGIHSHHHLFCCHTRSEGLAALCINWKQPPFHAGHNRTNDEQKSITKNVWRKDSFYNYTLCRYSIQQHLHKRKFVFHITYYIRIHNSSEHCLLSKHDYAIEVFNLQGVFFLFILWWVRLWGKNV